MPDDIVVIATLHVRPGQERLFREFEQEAVRIMRDHGGRLERAVRVTASLDGRVPPHEVHILRFPSEAHFEGYRRDPRLEDLDPLRASAIAETMILFGRDAEPYD